MNASPRSAQPPNAKAKSPPAKPPRGTPKPTAVVETLAISGTTVYAGGAFTEVGGSTREHIAAVCATAKCEGEVAAGKATAWNPKANGVVEALAISGTTVYAGGAFTEVGGSSRERLAAVCATAKCEGEVAAGKATAWNPNPNGSVAALTISGSTLYAGGGFTSMETGDKSGFASFREGALSFSTAPAMPTSRASRSMASPRPHHSND